MPKKLRKLKINRVDLCDKGANQEAHVLLFKRDDDGGTESETDVEKMAMTLEQVMEHDEVVHDAYEDRWKIVSAFERSLQSIAESDDEEERMRLTMMSAAQFVRLMGPIMDTLHDMEEVSMASKTQTTAKSSSGDAAVDETTHDQEETAMPMIKAEDVINLHVEVKGLKKDLEAKESELEAAVRRAELAEAELAKRDESTEDDIWKTATPAQRKAMEAERLEKIELQKKVAEGERFIRQRECIAKAQGYEYLPINPDDDWEIFHEIDKMQEAHANRIYQLLKAGDTNLRKSGLGKERGFNGNGEGPGDSALDQIEWLAHEEIVKSNNEISREEAIGKVAQAHPALYRKYTVEIQTRSAFDEGD